MRDKNRIEPFLKEFQELWEKYPDLRFGQLVYTLTNQLPNPDIFNIEEDEWSKAIKKLISRIKEK